MAERGMYYGSAVFARQRYFTQTADAYNPVAYGATRMVNPAPIPATIPPSGMRGPSGAGMGGALLEEGKVGGGGFGDNPWDLTQGILPAALIMLGLGLFWLHYVHFSK